MADEPDNPVFRARDTRISSRDSMCMPRLLVELQCAMLAGFFVGTRDFVVDKEYYDLAYSWNKDASKERPIPEFQKTTTLPKCNVEGAPSAMFWVG